MKKYRILLSNPPWYKIDNITKTGFLGCRAGSRWPHMRKYKGKMVSEYQPYPFFLATASALLKRDGFEADLHDSVVMGETYEAYFQYIIKTNPYLVVLEVSTPSIKNDIQIARKIKEINPDTLIVMCGIHYCISEKSFLEENLDVDFCIYGEYESPLLHLANSLWNRHGIERIPNLLYRTNNTVKKNKREQLRSLKEYPWPDRSFFPMNYYDGCGGMLGPELQVITARGCPYKCNFCIWPQQMYEGKYRTREPEDVIKEIKECMERYPYTHIYFDDDTINANKQHFMKLCELLIENGLNKYPWACMGRADLMDDEMLRLMKKAGCYAIKYGMESFDESVLQTAGKNLNLQKNVEMIIKTEELGIRVHVTYCLGLLGDTYDTVKRTINKSFEVPADSRQYSIATPFPGSKMWDQCTDMGYHISNQMDEFDANRTSVVNQDQLSAEDLICMKKEAEKRNKEIILERVPSTFRTNEFINNLNENISSWNCIGIMINVRKPICDYLSELISKMGKNVEFVNVTYDEINKYDVIILPTRRGSSSGLEAEVAVARRFATNVLLLYWHGKMEYYNNQ